MVTLTMKRRKPPAPAVDESRARSLVGAPLVVPGSWWIDPATGKKRRGDRTKYACTVAGVDFDDPDGRCFVVTCDGYDEGYPMSPADVRKFSVDSGAEGMAGRKAGNGKTTGGPAAADDEDDDKVEVGAPSSSVAAPSAMRAVARKRHARPAAGITATPETQSTEDAAPTTTAGHPAGPTVFLDHKLKAATLFPTPSAAGSYGWWMGEVPSRTVHERRVSPAEAVLPPPSSGRKSGEQLGEQRQYEQYEFCSAPATSGEKGEFYGRLQKAGYEISTRPAELINPTARPQAVDPAGDDAYDLRLPSLWTRGGLVRHLRELTAADPAESGEASPEAPWESLDAEELHEALLAVVKGDAESVARWRRLAQRAAQRGARKGTTSVNTAPSVVVTVRQGRIVGDTAGDWEAPGEEEEAAAEAEDRSSTHAPTEGDAAPQASSDEARAAEGGDVPDEAPQETPPTDAAPQKKPTDPTPRAPPRAPCPEHGPGWTVLVVPRKKGKRPDRYWFSPDGERFRSAVAVRRFLEAKEDAAEAAEEKKGEEETTPEAEGERDGAKEGDSRGASSPALLATPVTNIKVTVRAASGSIVGVAGEPVAGEDGADEADGGPSETAAAEDDADAGVGTGEGASETADDDGAEVEADAEDDAKGEGAAESEAAGDDAQPAPPAAFDANARIRAWADGRLGRLGLLDNDDDSDDSSDDEGDDDDDGDDDGDGAPDGEGASKERDDRADAGKDDEESLPPSPRSEAAGCLLSFRSSSREGEASGGGQEAGADAPPALEAMPPASAAGEEGDEAPAAGPPAADADGGATEGTLAGPAPAMDAAEENDEEPKDAGPAAAAVRPSVTDPQATDADDEEDADEEDDDEELDLQRKHSTGTAASGATVRALMEMEAAEGGEMLELLPPTKLLCAALPAADGAGEGNGASAPRAGPLDEEAGDGPPNDAENADAEPAEAEPAAEEAPPAADAPAEGSGPESKKETVAPAAATTAETKEPNPEASSSSPSLLAFPLPPEGKEGLRLFRKTVLLDGRIPALGPPGLDRAAFAEGVGRFGGRALERWSASVDFLITGDDPSPKRRAEARRREVPAISWPALRRFLTGEVATLAALREEAEGPLGEEGATGGGNSYGAPSDVAGPDPPSPGEAVGGTDESDVDADGEGAKEEVVVDGQEAGEDPSVEAKGEVVEAEEGANDAADDGVSEAPAETAARASESDAAPAEDASPPETEAPPTDAPAEGDAAGEDDGDASDEATGSPVAGDDASDDGSTNGSAHQDLLSRVAVGRRLSLFWPDDGVHYAGRVAGRPFMGRPSGARKHLWRIAYDDGETEVVDLAKEDFRILDEEGEDEGGSGAESAVEGDDGSVDAAAADADDAGEEDAGEDPEEGAAAAPPGGQEPTVVTAEAGDEAGDEDAPHPRPEAEKEVPDSAEATARERKLAAFLARQAAAQDAAARGDERSEDGAAAQEGEGEADSDDGTWACLKCSCRNPPSKKRCRACMGWKGGRRGGATKKGAPSTRPASLTGAESARTAATATRRTTISSEDAPLLRALGRKSLGLRPQPGKAPKVRASSDSDSDAAASLKDKRCTQRGASSSPGKSAASAPVPGTIMCKCKRSKCLLKYCPCYANGATCGDACGCVDCGNGPEAVQEGDANEGAPAGAAAADEGAAAPEPLDNHLSLTSPSLDLPELGEVLPSELPPIPFRDEEDPHGPDDEESSHSFVEGILAMGDGDDDGGNGRGPAPPGTPGAPAPPHRRPSAAGTPGELLALWAAGPETDIHLHGLGAGPPETIGELQKELRKTLERLDSIQTKLAAEKETTARLQASVDGMKVEAVAGNTSDAALQHQLASAEEELQILTDEHHESSVTLRTQISELQKDLDAAMDDNARLLMKLKDASDDLDAKTAELEELEHERDDAREQLEATVGKDVGEVVESFRYQEEKLRDEIAAGVKTVATLLSQKASVGRCLEEVTQQKTSLAEEVAALNADREALQRRLEEFDRLRDYVASLEDEVEYATVEKEQTEARLQFAEADIERTVRLHEHLDAKQAAAHDDDLASVAENIGNEAEGERARADQLEEANAQLDEDREELEALRHVHRVPPSDSEGSSVAEKSNAEDAAPQREAQQPDAAPEEGSSDKSAKGEASGENVGVPAEQQELLSRVAVGDRLSIFWPDDNVSYAGRVAARAPGRPSGARRHMYRIDYDDGETEILNLATEEFRILEEEDDDGSRGPEDVPKKSLPELKVDAAAVGKSKKKQQADAPSPPIHADRAEKRKRKKEKTSASKANKSTLLEKPLPESEVPAKKKSKKRHRSELAAPPLPSSQDSVASNGSDPSTWSKGTRKRMKKRLKKKQKKEAERAAKAKAALTAGEAERAAKAKEAPMSGEGETKKRQAKSVADKKKKKSAPGPLAALVSKIVSPEEARKKSDAGAPSNSKAKVATLEAGDSKPPQQEVAPKEREVIVMSMRQQEPNVHVNDEQPLLMTVPRKKKPRLENEDLTKWLPGVKLDDRLARAESSLGPPAKISTDQLPTADSTLTTEAGKTSKLAQSVEAKTAAEKATLMKQLSDVMSKIDESKEACDQSMALTSDGSENGSEKDSISLTAKKGASAPAPLASKAVADVPSPTNVNGETLPETASPTNGMEDVYADEGYYEEETAWRLHNPASSPGSAEGDATSEKKGGAVDAPEQLRRLPPAPPLPTELPSTGYCNWSFDDDTRVLLADFRNSPKAKEEGRVTMVPEDEAFLLRMMERDDISLVSEGLADGINPLLLSRQYIEGCIGSDYHHLFRSFETTSQTYQIVVDAKTKEKKGWYSMRVADYFKYLDQRRDVKAAKLNEGLNLESNILRYTKRMSRAEETFAFNDDQGEKKSVNVDEEAIYMCDVDMPKLLPRSFADFERNFKLPGILPGGSHCMMNAVNSLGKPFMGPNLYIAPPTAFTHLHQDGHGTTDSGHLCLSGYNEVIMLRRLTEKHKCHALNLLTGGEVNPRGILYGLPHEDQKTQLGWPSKDAIGKCKKMGYYPSVFILKAGQMVHINKGRLHAFNKLAPVPLPRTNCHADLRQEILRTKEDKTEDLCFSVAWDWMFKGVTSEGINREVSSVLECAKLNREHKVQSLGIPETALLFLAKESIAKHPVTSTPDPLFSMGSQERPAHASSEPDAETVLRGILPSLQYVVGKHSAVVERSQKQSEINEDSSQATPSKPDAWEDPAEAAINPYGVDDFQCKICGEELSNVYMHCDGCETLLKKDFNVCTTCHSEDKHGIFVQMHPLCNKMSSLHNHTGNMAESEKSGCCDVACANCKFCAGCSCRCHQEFSLCFRFMDVKDEVKLQRQAESIVGSNEIEHAAETRNRLYSLEPSVGKSKPKAAKKKRQGKGTRDWSSWRKGVTSSGRSRSDPDTEEDSSAADDDSDYDPGEKVKKAKVAKKAEKSESKVEKAQKKVAEDKKSESKNPEKKVEKARKKVVEKVEEAKSVASPNTTNSKKKPSRWGPRKAPAEPKPASHANAKKEDRESEDSKSYDSEEAARNALLRKKKEDRESEDAEKAKKKASPKKRKREPAPEETDGAEPAESPDRRHTARRAAKKKVAYTEPSTDDDVMDESMVDYEPDSDEDPSYV
ncbi:hypothetical protein ACHAXT_003766 [Thalassiosira profunda]